MIKVLLLYERLNPSVRLCAYEQLKELEKQGYIKLYCSELNRITQKMCQDSDTVFLVRASLTIEKLLAKRFKELGKKLVYVLDDDILNIPEESNSFIYYSHPIVKKRIVEIMKLCDTLISPSPLIIQKYGSQFAETLLIEEPCLEHCNKSESNEGVINIGFAGSIDRRSDFTSYMKQAISIVLEKYCNKISIEFFGTNPEFLNTLPIKQVPYKESYEEYHAYMKEANWAIGLAPMNDDPFHNCKHYNKFIEYGSFSIVGIYSNVYPYTRIVKNMENGLLCDNTVEAWVNGLSYLIENEIEIKRMSQNIYKEIEKDFLINKVSMSFLRIIAEMNEKVFNQSKKINLRWLKMYALYIRLLEFIKRYGLKSPFITLKKYLKI